MLDEKIVIEQNVLLGRNVAQRRKKKELSEE